MAATSNDRARLAELLGGLSLATDTVAGLPYETAMRTAVIATRIARALGAPPETCRTVYYASVLRFLGCSSFAPEWSRIAGGDDMGILGVLNPIDAKRPLDALGATARAYGVGASVRLMSDPALAKKSATAHCELATRLAEMLGLTQDVTTTLGQTYERFDGAGVPHGIAGDALSLATRILHVAFRCEVHRALAGRAAALAVLRERRGLELDPDVTDAMLNIADEVFSAVSGASVWETYISTEPLAVIGLAREQSRDVARAFAHAVDAKSAFTLGHSTGVSALAERAAMELNLQPIEADRVVTAALLHDLGRMAVPNGIWDKPGPLGRVERLRMESHAQHTETVLAFSTWSQPLAVLAASAHERVDGSGYPRRAAPPTMGARVIAAADAYHAMTEDRAYRPRLSPTEARTTLIEETRAGHYDRTAVDAVLTAAGHTRKTRARGGWPGSLSDREVEVLVLLARGQTNKQIAKTLFVSEKTVQHHVTHFYAKIGVSTRAAAAVYAIENELLDAVVITAKRL